MSRLSDLLNPAPTPQSTTPQAINVATTDSHHGRNASITSPLEALAIGATEPLPAASSLPLATSGPLPHPSHSHSQLLSRPQSDHSPGISSGDISQSQGREEVGITSSQPQATMSVQDGADSPNTSSTPGAPRDPTGQTAQHPEHVIQEDPVVDQVRESKPSVPTIVTEVKKEPETNPSTPAVQSPTVLPTTEGKKRSAPKSSKKGTASVIKKPAPKKRKIEAPSKDGTPMSQRSGTPNSSRASKTPAPKNRKRTSVTPAQSSPPRSVDGDDDDGDDDDGGIFCICRRPDDHKWMIGCDGGCDDWFHGKCVNMKEDDAELIDKYICPNCTEKGVGETTWKPMCRLEGCREPARVAPPNPSKYCSDEHGEEFMRQKIFGKGNAIESTASRKKKSATTAEPLHNRADGAADSEDNQAHLRGGFLKPSELKSLTSDSKDVSDFKRLGESVLAADSVHSTAREGKQDGDEDDGLLCTPEERSRLEDIQSKQAKLRARMESLKDKEKLLSLVRARVTESNKKSTVSKKKKAAPNMCGFDSRLSWSEVEFDQWRASDDGIKVLESKALSPLTSSQAQVDGDGDTKMAATDSNDASDTVQSVCVKLDCTKHRTWYKLHQQEIVSERGECTHQLRRLDRESRGINERAVLKRLEAEAKPSVEVKMQDA